MSCEKARLDLALDLREELSEVDATELKAHLATCVSCTAERRALGDTLDLTAAGSLGPPPEHLRAAVLAVVEAEQMRSMLELAVGAPPAALKARVLAAARRDTPRWGGTAVRALAAAALLAIGVFAGAVVFREDPSEIVAADVPPGHVTQTVRLSGDGPSSAEVRHYRHDNFRVTMSVDGFEPTPPGFHYGVWVRGTRGDVAVGTFRLKRADDFDIPFAVGVNPSDFPELVVTLEPNEGGPALEGEVVVRGRFDRDRVHHGTYDE